MAKFRDPAVGEWIDVYISRDAVSYSPTNETAPALVLDQSSYSTYSTTVLGWKSKQGAPTRWVEYSDDAVPENWKKLGVIVVGSYNTNCDCLPIPSPVGKPCPQCGEIH